MSRFLSVAFVLGLVIVAGTAIAQNPEKAQEKAPAPAAARPPRPASPTRDPHTPGYVTAKELPDGANPPVKTDGNFILGPTHSPAPEMTVQEGGPQGDVFDFTMESSDSKVYPGIALEANTYAMAH